MVSSSGASGRLRVLPDKISSVANSELCEFMEKTICGRRQLWSEIHEFVYTRITEGKGGALHITGKSGTGKSKCIHNVLSYSQSNCAMKMQIFRLDAETYSSERLTFRSVWKCLIGSEHVVNSEAEAKNKLGQIVSKLSKKSIYIFHLERIQLFLGSTKKFVAKSIEVLRFLFQLAERENCKFIFIAESTRSNLLMEVFPGQDMTEISQIVVKPYSKEECSTLLSYFLRLENIVVEDKFEESAIRELVGYVAPNFGSAEVLRNMADDLLKEQESTEIKISRIQVARFIAVGRSVNALSEFELPHRLVLATMVVTFMKHRKTKKTIPSVETEGLWNLLKQTMHRLHKITLLNSIKSFHEFMDVVDFLEFKDVVKIKIKKVKRATSCKVERRLFFSSTTSEEELRDLLSKDTLVSDIIEEAENLLC